VTGASSGIGRAIAIECSRMGATLFITARNKERLEETVAEMEGDGHKYLCADLSNDNTIDEIVESVDAKLDGIVQCAGYTIPKPFQFLSKEDMNGVMKVNFESPVLLTQLLLKNKKIEKDASIIFISSISGPLISSVGGSAYSASKAAVTGIIKAIAIELSTKNIRVNTIMPGMIDTNIFNSGIISEEQLKEDMKRYPLKRYGKPEEVAYAAIYLLSDASRWVTGSNLLIDGGYTLL
jgi:NAD(P)-dependent dehydrogenase (short-subunit alcohol dehydrogenase family)